MAAGTQLPHVKFVFPTAPVQPVTLNMGMRMNAWFDLKSLDNVGITCTQLPAGLLHARRGPHSRLSTC